MAANIPAKLRTADLTRFIVRAGQLELAKPVVAYWCEYWIVNQILSKGLHTGDDETLAYTMQLMDKLEKVKSDSTSNDAIVDDVAGQAYVEEFALETFNRADRAVQAGKVTKQTADTFQAAVTFLELVNVWAAPDAETQGKIKYAKWNAVRIMKALKEGKDPNDSNPKSEPVSEEVLPELDPNDPEVKGLEDTPESRHASVMEVPDEQDLLDQRMARQSSIDQSLHPSAQISARVSPATPSFVPLPRDNYAYASVQDDNVSPLEPSPPNERTSSVGGGYFPEVPTFTGKMQEPSRATAPDDFIDLGLPEQPSFAPETKSPGGVDPFQPPPNFASDPAASHIDPPITFYRPATGTPPNTTFGPPPQAPYHPPPPQQQTYQHPQTPHQPSPSSQPTYQQPPPQRAVPPPAAVPPGVQPALDNSQLNTDDAAIAKAQKHARFAISALNFEDAETAVRELRDALKTLGAV
ncbi:Vta1 like-domain-containing protein [Calycina marina]|uniref:Vta1 like-domain-containing protein n=1 Tax=Calycina marina TaxID=1763456 RepID=A0A9P7Z1R1_9HELO|nr:Vta1 like-domain-containing protein [Calycina marina]